MQIYLMLKQTFFYIIFFNLLIINELKAQFDKYLPYWQAYIQSEDFRFKIDSSYTSEEVKVDIFSFHNQLGINVKGFISYPKNLKNDLPAVIYQHSGGNDKTQFLEEMLELSQKNIVCLSLDAPKNEFNKGIAAKRNFAFIFQEGVTNIQVALAYLLDMYKVDNQRVAFVGHSYGANVGAILAGIEPAIKYFILMAGTPRARQLYNSFNENNLQKLNEQTPKERYDLWTSVLKPYDAEHFIPRTQAQILHQFALEDEIIPLDLAEHYFQITPEPKRAVYYNCRHQMQDYQAQQDRKAWLLEVFGLHNSQKN
jgi:cephalosporin-C deacetylase-like acetyl esterase